MKEKKEYVKISKVEPLIKKMYMLILFSLILNNFVGNCIWGFLNVISLICICLIFLHRGFP